MQDGIKKISLLTALLLCGAVIQAQVLGTKTPYTAPHVQYTQPPAGFKPVFINYVGRHGARYMTKAGPDLAVLKLLDNAAKEQGLTATGLQVRPMVAVLCKAEKGKYENITLLGAEEQQGIGQRMMQLYPTAFAGNGLDVQVTYKVRTQQSADAFLRGFTQYKGVKNFTKRADTLDDVLRFYDLSPAYQAYKQGEGLKMSFDSLQNDARAITATKAVCARVFTPAFLAKMSPAEQQSFFEDLYGLYAIQFSLVLETNNATGLGTAFNKSELDWEDFVGGAQDFLEKGPGRDALGVQVKVAAPLLVDFIKAIDAKLKNNQHADAVLRFTHAEAISPFAALLGIPGASVPSAAIAGYRQHWQADRVIPLSANIQWIVYSNGSEYLVKVLLNEREVALPIPGGPYYRWNDLRAFYINRLHDIGADLNGDMLEYLKGLK